METKRVTVSTSTCSPSYFAVVSATGSSLNRVQLLSPFETLSFTSRVVCVELQQMDDSRVQTVILSVTDPIWKHRLESYEFSSTIRVVNLLDCSGIDQLLEHWIIRWNGEACITTHILQVLHQYATFVKLLTLKTSCSLQELAIVGSGITINSLFIKGTYCSLTRVNTPIDSTINKILSRQVLWPSTAKLLTTALPSKQFDCISEKASCNESDKDLDIGQSSRKVAHLNCGHTIEISNRGEYEDSNYRFRVGTINRHWMYSAPIMEAKPIILVPRAAAKAQSRPVPASPRTLLVDQRRDFINEYPSRPASKFARTPKTAEIKRTDRKKNKTAEGRRRQRGVLLATLTPPCPDLQLLTDKFMPSIRAQWDRFLLIKEELKKEKQLLKSSQPTSP